MYKEKFPNLCELDNRGKVVIRNQKGGGAYKVLPFFVSDSEEFIENSNISYDVKYCNYIIYEKEQGNIIDNVSERE